MLRTSRIFVRSLVRIFVGGVIAIATGSAQQVAVTLGSGSAMPGASVNVDLSLTAANPLPASLQWRVTYPISLIGPVTFVASPATTAAGKSLSCSSNTGWTDCVLFGLNTATVPTGVIATATVTVLPGATSTAASLGLSNLASADAAGAPLPTSGTGGSINILVPASTWSLSGTITLGAGATVALSGAASKTVTADASGNYSFPGLANGTYTVTPTGAGLVMTPSSRSVTVSGANQTGVNFSTSSTTWGISGAVTSGAGATVTLSGAANRTVTADASGNYSFPGLVNGTYTVTPTKTSVIFTPSTRAVTLNGANQTGVNFSGADQTSTTPTIDQTVWTDQNRSTTSFSSPAFSTTQGNELILAFIGTNSTSGIETVRSVRGGGLAWELIRRTNGQSGTAEIWRAFSPNPLQRTVITASLSQRVTGSITIVTLYGVDASGTNGAGAIGGTGGAHAFTGAPAVSLVANRRQSLVLGIGNDARSGTHRLPAGGQSLVHEYVENRKGTYWVQKIDAPTANAMTQVTMSDSAPTSSSYNFTIAEILGPAPVTPLMYSAPSSALRAPEAPSETTSLSSPSTGAVLTGPVTGEPGDACSPGGWASLAGTGFTSWEPQSPQSLPLPTELAGVQVEINGEAAPLLLASAGQINFQCPQLPPGTPLHMRVSSKEGKSWTVADSAMSAAVPVLFTESGTSRAVVQISATGELVGSASASNTEVVAQPGEYIRLYATGLGEVEMEIAPGTSSPLDRVIRLKNRATVLLGGIEVEPLFAGLTPGTVGVFQLDLKIPPFTGTGLEVPLFVRIEFADGTMRLSPASMIAIEAAGPAAHDAVERRSR